MGDALLLKCLLEICNETFGKLNDCFYVVAGYCGAASACLCDMLLEAEVNVARRSETCFPVKQNESCKVSRREVMFCAYRSCSLTYKVEFWN